jgi:hypothetical protein
VPADANLNRDPRQKVRRNDLSPADGKLIRIAKDLEAGVKMIGVGA